MIKKETEDELERCDWSSAGWLSGIIFRFQKTGGSAFCGGNIPAVTGMCETAYDKEKACFEKINPYFFFQAEDGIRDISV